MPNVLQFLAFLTVFVVGLVSGRWIEVRHHAVDAGGVTSVAASDDQLHVNVVYGGSTFRVSVNGGGDLECIQQQPTEGMAMMGVDPQAFFQFIALDGQHRVRAVCE